MSQVTVIKAAPVAAYVKSFGSGFPEAFPVWLATYKYALGDRVLYNNAPYKCIKAYTAASSETPAQNIIAYPPVAERFDGGYLNNPLASWEVYNDTNYIHPWVSGSYSVGSVVTYGKLCYFRVNNDNTVDHPLTDSIGPDLDTWHWDISDRDYPAFNPSTTYNKGDRVSWSTLIYETVSNGTIGVYPSAGSLTNPKSWSVVQKVNRWLMFDNLTYSAAKPYTDQINLTIQTTAYINAIAFLNVDANTITVTVSGGTKALSPYTGYTTALVQTINMNPANTAANVWPIEDINRKTSAVFYFDRGKNYVITVTIAKTATSPPSCGTLIIGNAQALGNATTSGLHYGASVGIEDYSTTNADEYGTVTFTRRNWVKKVSGELLIPNADLDGIQRLIAGLRATSNVWVCADPDNFESLTVYGYVSNFSAAIKYPLETLMQLEVKGVI